MLFLYFAWPFYPKANTMQIIVPIHYSDFSFCFVKFGVLFTDYEDILSIFDHLCKRKKKCIEVLPTLIPWRFQAQQKAKNAYCHI